MNSDKQQPKGIYKEQSDRLRNAAIGKDLESKLSLLNTVESRGRIDLHDTVRVKEIIGEYLGRCRDDGQIPTVMGLSAALGVSRRWLNMFMSENPRHPTTAFLDVYKELSADALDEIQGLDFGFTNDPTARVQIYADHRRKIAYIRERCYRKGMKNDDIADDMQADGVGRYTEVFADCAEPKSIEEIRARGFNVIACSKDAPQKSDKKKFQIQWCQGWKFYVTTDSVNLIRELRNYTWAQDRDGNSLNYPIGDFDHALDAVRYALWTKYAEKPGYGIYNIAFNR